MSLAEILETAASALPDDADSIRPANGDPIQLLELLGREASQRVLEWLLANEPEVGAELALAWLELDDGPAVLTSLEEGALPKVGRKGLRKALHRLRSKGVALPQQEKVEPIVSRLPPIAEAVEVGYVSCVDPRGARLVYLLQPNPSGGGRLFEILLDENRGVVECEAYSAGWGRIRRFVKDAVGRTRFQVVEASPESLRALVARIAARHPPERALPSAFLEWRSKLAIPGETPGDRASAALSLSGDGSALARAVELAKQGSIGPWGQPASELSARMAGRIEVEAEKESGSEDWSGLAAEVFLGEQAAISAERLRENAYVMWKLDREDDARACLAAAEVFASEAAANPVASAMAEVLLAPAVEARRARNAPSGHEE